MIIQNMRTFVSLPSAQEFLNRSKIAAGVIVKRRGTSSLRLVICVFIEKNVDGHYVPNLLHVALNMQSQQKIANIDDFIVAFIA